ncbi:MAG: sensor domain-containing protein [Pseudomonadota bacterium]
MASDALSTTIVVADEELRRLLAEHQAILQNALVGIAFIRERRIMRCNRRLEQIFGYGPGELDGRPTRLMYRSDIDYRVVGEEAYRDVRRLGHHQREQILVRRDGTPFWCRLQGKLVDADNPAAGHVFLYEDITERRHAEQQVAQALAEQELILNNAVVGIAFVRNRIILRCNRRMEELFGCSPGEMNGQPTRPYYAHQEDYDYAGRRVYEEAPEREHQFEFQFRRKDGSLFWCKLTGRPIDARDSGQGWIWNYEDVTEHRRAQEALLEAQAALERRVRERTAELASANARLLAEVAEREQAEHQVRHLANHDALTGLPNRRLLHDRLGQALALAHRHQDRLAVLFIDLDRFKTINDSLGHHCGDELLKEVARRLGEALREGDTVSRLGGDEFVVVLTGLAEAGDAALVADKIVAALAVPHLIGGHELRVTPSIGISIYPDDGACAETLLRNADTAMYHAKDMGRNNYQFFAEEMNVALSRRLQLENSLYRALERDELALHFQPRLCLDTGRICALEALLRWRHPDKGMVPPHEFIAVAEESDLIVKVGRWVLERACRQIVAWERKGLAAPRVSVNLSPRQFRQKGLAPMIAAILGETGVDPRRLELEITETSLMQRTEQTLSTLEQLHRMGVQLSIDDFGTGYSSLSYLKRFPVHQLKIDQSFVRDLTTDPDDAAIVSAIVGLAKNLDLRVVAEGVETAEQYAFIAASGCHEAQGFFLGAPRPAEEIEELFAAAVPTTPRLSTPS